VLKQVTNFKCFAIYRFLAENIDGFDCSEADGGTTLVGKPIAPDKATKPRDQTQSRMDVRVV